MTVSRIALVGIAFIAGTFIASDTASAASYQHIDMLVQRIQANSASLEQEFQLHCRRIPQYPHLISDAHNLSLQSTHIHASVHRGASVYHLAGELRSLDYRFQHLQQLLIHAQPGAHEHGHVQQLMQEIECDIDHLRADIAALAQPPRIIVTHVTHVHRGHSRRYYTGFDPARRPGRRQRNQSTPAPRNYGEIRSGWTRSLSDL